MSIWANGSSRRSETKGPGRLEKGGPDHEGFTVEPGRKGEKAKQAFQNVVFSP